MGELKRDDGMMTYLERMQSMSHRVVTMSVCRTMPYDAQRPAVVRKGTTEMVDVFVWAY